MDHDIGPVQCRPFGLMIQKRAPRRENIPRVVDVKIRHAQAEREMNAGHGIIIDVNGHKLSLRKDLSMIFEFVERVRILGGVNELANLDDGLVIRAFHESDSIVGRKHKRLMDLGSRRRLVVQFLTTVWRANRIMLWILRIAMVEGERTSEPPTSCWWFQGEEANRRALALTTD
jgi:hypothetical protein